MSVVSIVLLAAAIGPADFRELRCRGVPLYPDGKQVVLRQGQVQQSAVDGRFFSLVEFEGMVGLLHYNVRRVGPKVLRGTATRISTSNWKTVSAPVTCQILM
jgi:hypothetical protein